MRLRYWLIAPTVGIVAVLTFVGNGHAAPHPRRHQPQRQADWN